MDSTTTNGSNHDNIQDNPPTSSTTEEGFKEEQDEYANARHGKFRFKSSKARVKRDDSSSSSHRHSDQNHQHRHSHSHRQRRRHHHGNHRSTKRRKTESSPPPSPPSLHNPPLSPNAAFRESLFDALADDEGAAFWQSVYGQPIHTYAVPSVPKGPDGELERMTEEEYAAYVRARMWERSHEGMMEERERLRREKAKEKKRAETRGFKDEERLRFEKAVGESLRRGQERRRSKAWKAVWEEYQRSWETLNAVAMAKEEPDSGSAATGSKNKKPFIARNHLFWPVESGKRRDVSREAVTEFMHQAPAAASDPPGHADILATLKTERVRWHPDKMLHRYGSLGLNNEPAVIRSVTEVFQILDQLWIEEREKHKT